MLLLFGDVSVYEKASSTIQIPAKVVQKDRHGDEKV